MAKGYMSHIICCGDRAYINHIIYINTNGIISVPEPFYGEKESIKFTDAIIVVLSADAAPHKDEIITTLSSAISKNPEEHPSEIILKHHLYKKFQAKPESQSIIIEIYT
ncbi:MAG: hypothetical protein RR293_03960 [Bacteroidales bacterium]